MVNKGLRALAFRSSLIALGLLSITALLDGQQTQHYKQTNLVSDMPGVAAVTDPNLVNPWGISRSSTSPWWVSDNGTGLATLYMGTGSIVPLVVTIPSGDPNTSPTGTPTGQVFNGTNDFQLAPNLPAVFIFVTEDGTVSGWNPKVQATTAVIKFPAKLPVDGTSVFKGLALATVNDPLTGPTNYLYVADFRQGKVQLFDTNFNPVSIVEEAFRDDRIPDGFAPFNIQNIGGNLYVAYAKQDSQKHDEVDGPRLGYVDVFSPTGRLLHRLEHGRFLNAPWGMTQAPSDFGIYSHNILVGQFGSGNIAVFDPVTGRFKGMLNDANDAPINIDGLWSIAFGGGGNSGPSNSLFFTAGTGGEQHGLFGTITAIENFLGGDQ